ATGIRVLLDARTDTGFGRRIVDWEIKGVPLRIEVGPRDLARGEVVVSRRHDATKRSVPLAGLEQLLAEELAATHAALLGEATEFLHSHLVDVTSVDEAREAAEESFARLPAHLVDDAAENALNDAGVSVRCLVSPDLSRPDPAAPLDELVAIIGRAY
ncbi:MAG: His/Gly/Thr/Pro-type tRNA ligase C-terminal domain-containing protein, partial [Acidimicrobiales bacterium]